jgi:hypothetical protein
VSFLTLLRENLIPAVATAAVLGGGATIIDNKVRISGHEERIKRIEELDKTMDELRGDLRETRETLVRVEARQIKE